MVCTASNERFRVLVGEYSTQSTMRFCDIDEQTKEDTRPINTPWGIYICRHSPELTTLLRHKNCCNDCITMSTALWLQLLEDVPDKEEADIDIDDNLNIRLARVGDNYKLIVTAPEYGGSDMYQVPVPYLRRVSGYGVTPFYLVREHGVESHACPCCGYKYTNDEFTHVCSVCGYSDKRLSASVTLK